jgi:hypothetical protein
MVPKSSSRIGSKTADRVWPKADRPLSGERSGKGDMTLGSPSDRSQTLPFCPVESSFKIASRGDDRSPTLLRSPPPHRPVRSDPRARPGTESRILHADKGCDSDAIRRQIEATGAAPNIRPKANRRWKACFSPVLYRGRNAIERMVLPPQGLPSRRHPLRPARHELPRDRVPRRDRQLLVTSPGPTLVMTGSKRANQSAATGGPPMAVPSLPAAGGTDQPERTVPLPGNNAP